MTMDTMTATAGSTSRKATRSSGFMDTVASEWVKLTTLRSTHVTLGLCLALSIAATALVTLAVGATFDSWPASEQAVFEPITLSMVGNTFTLIILTAFGVLAVSSEHASGMIRLTLTATPRRGRILLAKLLLVAAITLVLGMVTVIGMFLVGQAVLEAYGMPVADLSETDAQRVVLGLGAVTPLFPIIGLALGVIPRSTAGAITTALAILWLPVTLGGMLPLWWQEHVLSLLPGPAVDSFTIGYIVDSPMYPDPVVGALIAAVWLVGFLGAAWLRLERRDV